MGYAISPGVVLVLFIQIGNQDSRKLYVPVSLASFHYTATDEPFCKFASRSSYDSASVLEIVLTVSDACALGFQSMGHSTPCLATAWNASRRRRASRTLRPTVRLLSVI